MLAIAIFGISAVAVGALAGSGEPSRLAQETTNGRIAFVANNTGISLVNPDGTGVWGMSVLLPSDADPAWSRDGTRLAVTSRWPTMSGIRVMDGTGTTLSRLTTDGEDTSPTWSPDGSQVAYIGHGDGQIWIIGSDGSGRRKVTSGAARHSHLSWSPDGKTIVASAYDSDACCASDIFALDVAGGGVANLTKSFADDQWPAWSPDGSRIAIRRDGELWLLRPDGTDLQRLTTGSYDNNPEWAPDGSRVAFNRNGSIWSLPATGGEPTQVTSGISGAWGGLSWQPIGADPTGRCSLWGTPGPDLLVGSAGPDTSCGFGGSDTIVGLAGDDSLEGGVGNDVVAGGAGRDVLIGGAGSDRLDARDGARDRIFGGGAAKDVALVDPSGDRVTGVRTKRASWNVAAWRTVTASSVNTAGPAEMAVDGSIEDWWNSGAYPWQWIEIDLGRPTTIGRIRLIASEQQSAGPIIVLGRGPDTGGTYRALTRFTGPTVDKQELARSPRTPWRRVRYLRVVSGASNGPQNWVAWREIEVYPPGH